jgi:hypothetical protein
MGKDIWMAMQANPDLLDIPFWKRPKPLQAGYRLGVLYRSNVEIYGFLERYAGDLPRLYALDRKCSRLVAKIGFTVFSSSTTKKELSTDDRANLLGADDCPSPGDEVTERDMLKEVTATVPELQLLIDLKTLCRDVVRLRSVYGACGEFEPTEPLNTLVILLNDIQARIEAEKGTRLEKAEGFLESYENETLEFGEIEALTYLFSRGTHPDIVAEQSIIRWKERQDYSTLPFEDRFIYDNAIGRLIHSSNISGYRSVWDRRVPSDLRSDGVSDGYRVNFTQMLFRSELFKEYRSDDLGSITLDLEEYLLEDMAHYTPNHIDRGYFGHPYNVLLAASLIFAYHRMGGKGASKKTINELTDNLLRYQMDTGAWGTPDYDVVAIIPTAMVLHALALAEPSQWQKPAARAVEWLWTMQNNYGCWWSELLPCAVTTTVLVLDAIELAGGVSNVTFDKKRKETIASTDSLAKMSVSDLAQKYNLPKAALRKRLERWRDDHDGGWYEVADAGHRDARILYLEAHVQHIIDDMLKK